MINIMFIVDVITHIAKFIEWESYEYNSMRLTCKTFQYGIKQYDDIFLSKYHQMWMYNQIFDVELQKDIIYIFIHNSTGQLIKILRDNNVYLHVDVDIFWKILSIGIGIPHNPMGKFLTKLIQNNITTIISYHSKCNYTNYKLKYIICKLYIFYYHKKQKFLSSEILKHSGNLLNKLLICYNSITHYSIEVRRMTPVSIPQLKRKEILLNLCSKLNFKCINKQSTCLIDERFFEIVYGENDVPCINNVTVMKIILHVKYLNSRYQSFSKIEMSSLNDMMHDVDIQLFVIIYMLYYHEYNITDVTTMEDKKMNIKLTHLAGAVECGIGKYEKLNTTLKNIISNMDFDMFKLLFTQTININKNIHPFKIPKKDEFNTSFMKSMLSLYGEIWISKLSEWKHMILSTRNVKLLEFCIIIAVHYCDYRYEMQLINKYFTLTSNPLNLLIPDCTIPDSTIINLLLTYGQKTRFDSMIIYRLMIHKSKNNIELVKRIIKNKYINLRDLFHTYINWGDGENDVILKKLYISILYENPVHILSGNVYDIPYIADNEHLVFMQQYIKNGHPPELLLNYIDRHIHDMTSKTANYILFNIYSKIKPSDRLKENVLEILKFAPRKSTMEYRLLIMYPFLIKKERYAKYRQDKFIMLNACASNGALLAYASKHLRNLDEIVSVAIINNIGSIVFASSRLQNDKAFITKSIM